ncbi:hypothetical protein QFZ22_009617 [Streptomyces canus]|uniref:Transposase IS4-like domain-containing protein n=1 Tax=Streptomyces canus TaxID=58343 RepID=A0AAW8FW80_9ACTN|nr:hypothetical protein [Streptomyces canus]
MDPLGLPVMITVTPADVQDRDAARDVFWRLRLIQPQITQVWEDRDYAGELGRAAVGELEVAGVEGRSGRAGLGAVSSGVP